MMTPHTPVTTAEVLGPRVGPGLFLDQSTVVSRSLPLTWRRWRRLAAAARMTEWEERVAGTTLEDKAT